MTHENNHMEYDVVVVCGEALECEMRGCKGCMWKVKSFSSSYKAVWISSPTRCNTMNRSVLYMKDDDMIRRLLEK